VLPIPSDYRAGFQQAGQDKAVEAATAKKAAKEKYAAAVSIWKVWVMDQNEWNSVLKNG
jgi:phosphoserine aminotransferase